MATYTGMINSVLRRLRESEVASPTSSDYAALIGDLVNEAKREVEDAWEWHALSETKTVTTASGTSQYAVTDAGKRFKLTDKRFSVYDATNKARLSPQNPMWLKEQAIVAPQLQKPCFYYFEGFDASGDPYINLYGTPDGTYTINISMLIPQDDFTVGTEVLSVPEYPVILSAYAKAIAERGEDSGRSHGEAMAAYASSLSDSIARDAHMSHDSEVTWYV